MTLRRNSDPKELKLPNLSIWPNQQNFIAIYHTGTCNDYVRVKEGPTPEVVGLLQVPVLLVDIMVHQSTV